MKVIDGTPKVLPAEQGQNSAERNERLSRFSRPNVLRAMLIAGAVLAITPDKADAAGEGAESGINTAAFTECINATSAEASKRITTFFLENNAVGGELSEKISKAMDAFVDGVVLQKGQTPMEYYQQIQAEGKVLQAERFDEVVMLDITVEVCQEAVTELELMTHSPNFDGAQSTIDDLSKAEEGLRAAEALRDSAYNF